MHTWFPLPKQWSNGRFWGAHRITQALGHILHITKTGDEVEIKVRLWGNIAYYLPEVRGRFTVKKSVEPETTVRQLVADLQLPKQLSFLIIANGRVIKTDYVLREGDEIDLYQPPSGG